MTDRRRQPQATCNHWFDGLNKLVTQICYISGSCISNNNSPGPETWVIASGLLDSFAKIAFNHSPSEFMGWLCGKVVKRTGKVIINTAYCPQQAASDCAVWDDGSTAQDVDFIEFLTKHGIQVVGWVHTHPTFDAFLSSVDQHQAVRLQNEFPDALSIVIDKMKKPFFSTCCQKGWNT